MKNFIMINIKVSKPSMGQEIELIDEILTSEQM